jgi:hypothetical protein
MTPTSPQIGGFVFSGEQRPFGNGSVLRATTAGSV